MATLFTQLLPQLRTMFLGQDLSPAWKKAAQLYYKLQVHADGETPIWLIKKARPNESEVVRQYREDIYEPESQDPIEAVFAIFDKIRRSPDFMIQFKNEDVPPSIVPEETPEKYLTENYPDYDSIEYWLFEEGKRAQGLDANAVVAVMPKSINGANDAVNNNEYIDYVARVFYCPDVVKLVENDFAVLKSGEYSSLMPVETQYNSEYSNQSHSQTIYNDKVKNPVFHPGHVYYVITTLYYAKFEENKEAKFQMTELFEHGQNELPVFRIRGKFVKRIGNEIIKKSVLDAMVPHLNKAARESNDLDAGVLQHLHVQRWFINNRECKGCSGTGSIIGTNGNTDCQRCKGTGWAGGKNPFEDVEVNPSKLMLNGMQLPIPPVGEVQKNPEIIKIQNERVEQHIFKAYSSVHMQNVVQTPLNQSGTAKEWDHDAENNVVYSFGEDQNYMLTKSCYYIIKFRYADVIRSEEDLQKLQPYIPVPEKFDIINTSFLLQEYQSGKTAGLNGIILGQLQKEISQKKFYNEPEVLDFVELVMDLDPFPQLTVEEKSLMLTNKMATDLDIILSIYISDFVKEALEENPKFNELTIKEKRKKLDEMAQEKIDLMNAAKQVVQDILGQQQPQDVQQVQQGQQPLPLRGNGVITNPNSNFATIGK